jgi:hypothetical protein
LLSTSFQDCHATARSTPAGSPARFCGDRVLATRQIDAFFPKIQDITILHAGLAEHMKAANSVICYLCGKPLSEPSDRDHIPLRGLFSEEIRKTHNLSKLITLSVHRDCNALYKLDEEYFIYTLYPFALGTYAGDTMRKHVRRKFHAGKNRKLVAKMMAEFDHRPAGLGPIRSPG